MGTDVTVMGEVLIDFTSYGVSEGGMTLYERNPGGAPANVACAVARLGGRSAFIGKVGADDMGDFLRGVLEREGVDVNGLVRDRDVFTTLAFVTLGRDGERSFAFARKPGADTRLSEGEVNTGLIKASKVFHFGSLSLTDEPSRRATEAAVKAARDAGVIVSFDPNYRPFLWESREAASRSIRGMLPYVDIIKISDEELELVTGLSDPAEALTALRGQGVACSVVTMGPRGAMGVTRGEGDITTAPGISVSAIDATGAGDAFWGAFLYKLTNNNADKTNSGAACKRPAELSAQDLAGYMAFANKAAAFCVERRGAIPALARLKDLG